MTREDSRQPAAADQGKQRQARGLPIPSSDIPPTNAAEPRFAETPGANTELAQSPQTPATSTAPGLDDGTPPPRKRRRVGWIITVILLSLALVATGAVLAVALIRLAEAMDEIERRGDLIDQKETFASAAQGLMDTAAQFDGVPYATIVKTDLYSSIIGRAWHHRWSPESLDRDTEAISTAADQLAGILTTAHEQASTNGTGSYLESQTDQLGAGFLTTAFGSAEADCDDADAWGCVWDNDPFTIHYDEADMASQPFMSDWLRQGVAYHEYAHVLQITNPKPTKTALESFGGDEETMADCYALTYLPGWTLDHRIWISEYEYWDVSVGYGYTCDESQRQVVREWVGALGYRHEPIPQ